VSEGASRVPAVLLAACTMGLVVLPFLYMLAGAPADLPPIFSRFFLLGSVYLVWRYLSKPASDGRSSAAVLVPELLSWLAVAVFLWIASGINLLRGFERLGAACMFFLIASVICLPVMAFRRTQLESRWTRVPRPPAMLALLLVLVTSAVIVVIHLSTPARFIGSKGPPVDREAY
jgi:hypothetical protein